jgi:hypothetical protein
MKTLLLLGGLLLGWIAAGLLAFRALRARHSNAFTSMEDYIILAAVLFFMGFVVVWVVGVVISNNGGMLG